MGGFIIFIVLLACVHAQDRVLLKDVSVLTLQAGKLTTGRRSTPIQQLLCQNCDDAASKNVVSTIQCKNAGFDGKDVNWRCETSIDKRYSLQKTEVSCEGHLYPEDPHILVGSCAVKYWLNKPLAQKLSLQDEIVVISVMGLFVVCFVLIALCVWCPSSIQHNPNIRYSPPMRHRGPPVYSMSTTPVYYPPVPTYAYAHTATPVFVNAPPIIIHESRVVETRHRTKDKEEE
jgi:hypothetical protein